MSDREEAISPMVLQTTPQFMGESLTIVGLIPTNGTIGVPTSNNEVKLGSNAEASLKSLACHLLIDKYRV